MKDITLTSLMRGSGQDFLEHNPVATYINGTYWGMYNLREKINEHSLASKHNINADDITLLTNNAEEIEGDNDEYNELINFINTNDLTIDSNFEYVAQIFFSVTLIGPEIILNFGNIHQENGVGLCMIQILDLHPFSTQETTLTTP